MISNELDCNRKWLYTCLWECWKSNYKIESGGP